MTKEGLDWAGDVAERIATSDKITDTGLRILKLMIQSNLDILDMSRVASHASDALDRTKGDEKVKKTWQCLHEAMLDKGLYQKI